MVSPRKPAGPLGGHCSSQGLILRMLYSAKRHDLETEAMWAVKVSWSSIMTPRFLAVLDGTRDKESILMLMLWWMACLAGKTISSVFGQVQLKVVIFHPCGYISKTVRDPRRDSGVLRRERQKQLSIIGIVMIGKTIRADDRAQQGGVNGKEKWSHHRALGHPSGEAVRYRQLTLP